jgi:hypothetical protein
VCCARTACLFFSNDGYLCFQTRVTGDVELGVEAALLQHIGKAIAHDTGCWSAPSPTVNPAAVLDQPRSDQPRPP